MLRRILGISSLFALLSTPLLAKTFTIGGARPASLLTPSANKTEKIPLLIFLHGYTSNAAQSDAYLGISRQRDALGFAIVLPDGTQNSDGARFWNATPECCDFEQSGVDDAGYIAGLIREAATVAPIDLRRVYLIGHSNGGFMSYRMACEYPEMIHGIISIAGAFFKDQALCKKPGPINILQIHGTEDTTIPMLGSTTFPATQIGLDYWINRYACDKGQETLNALDLVTAAGNETDSVVWNNCTGSSKVGFWKIKGAGHVPSFNGTWLTKALNFVN